MKYALSREIRKTLVRLAENNESEYGPAARIILALSSGKDEQQVATAVGLPLSEVKHWQSRFEAEGEAIFAEVVPESTPTPALSTSESDQSPATEEQQDDEADTSESDDDTDDDDDYEDRSEVHQGRPPRNRPISRRAKRSRERRQKRQTAHDDKDKEDDDSQSSTSPSIDNAVNKGVENLVSDSDATDDIDIPPRKVIITTSTRDLSTHDFQPTDTEPVPETSAELDEVDQLIKRYGLPDPYHKITVDNLAEICEVDMTHAHHIGLISQQFFDATAGLHRLPDKYRDLLYAAAKLLNIAYKIDPENHHIIGRDLVLKYQLQSISPEERQMIAAMIAFHHLTPRPHYDIAYMNLPVELRTITQTLAAIIRIAVGLDYSRSQTSQIIDQFSAPGEMTLVIEGREATMDATRAHQKADLWNRLYSASQLRLITARQAKFTDYIIGASTLSISLAADASPVIVTNQLRLHYSDRFQNLVNIILDNQTDGLISLWREFQRLTGIWVWLYPGARSAYDNLKADTDWFARSIYGALQYNTSAKRSQNILDSTDPEQDDPEAIASLREICGYYERLAARSFQQLQEAFQDDRYTHWFNNIREELPDENYTGLPFGALVARQAWIYLHEIRQIIQQVNTRRQQDVENGIVDVKTIQAFEIHSRRLLDSLIFSASVLDHEYEQALDMLSPVLDYTRTWQRLEQVALQATSDRDRASQKQGGSTLLALEALAHLIRQQADHMRDKLPDMWQPLDTTNFRQLLAKAIALP